MSEPLVEIKNLTKQYIQSFRGLFKRYQTALNNISFTIEHGDCLAIVGEAGSGKTTLAKILAGAESASFGTLSLQGDSEIFSNQKALSSAIRMIFQDPITSLNPRLTVGQLLEEPLKFNRALRPERRKKMVTAKLAQVGLLKDHYYYYPSMLSGGQKQRVAVARALMLDPKVIIADEALTNLDVSVRSQIFSLLFALQQKNAMAIVIITHDLNLVKRYCDKTLVLLNGERVEFGRTEHIFNSPSHEYTKQLVHEHNQLNQIG